MGDYWRYDHKNRVKHRAFRKSRGVGYVRQWVCVCGISGQSFDGFLGADQGEAYTPCPNCERKHVSADSARGDDDGRTGDTHGY